MTHMGIGLEPLSETEEKYNRVVGNIAAIKRKLDSPNVPDNRKDALRAALTMQRKAVAKYVRSMDEEDSVLGVYGMRPSAEPAQ
ncbi:hypothetical protein D4Q80_00520 [bacterium]|nr:MAG: hypothetical protein D4Q80_00520 [bacterium]